MGDALPYPCKVFARYWVPIRRRVGDPSHTPRRGFNEHCSHACQRASEVASAEQLLERLHPRLSRSLPLLHLLWKTRESGRWPRRIPRQLSSPGWLPTGLPTARWLPSRGLPSTAGWLPTTGWRLRPVLSGPEYDAGRADSTWIPTSARLHAGGKHQPIWVPTGNTTWIETGDVRNLHTFPNLTFFLASLEE